MTATTDFELPTAGPGVLAPNALRDPKVRERMSPAAVRLFMRLGDLWHLAVDQRRVLLGDISKPTYHNWQNGKVGTLTRDQLERISLVLGIHKGLNCSPTRQAPSGGLRVRTATCRSAGSHRSSGRSRAASMISMPCAATLMLGGG